MIGAKLDPAHDSTRPDTPDVKKVMATVTKHNLQTPLGNREHQAFPGNPLAKFDVEKTLKCSGETWGRDCRRKRNHH